MTKVYIPKFDKIIWRCTVRGRREFKKSQFAYCHLTGLGVSLRYRYKTKSYELYGSLIPGYYYQFKAKSFKQARMIAASVLEKYMQSICRGLKNIKKTDSIIFRDGLVEDNSIDD